MSSCLVSRGLRVQFLPPAPISNSSRAGAAGLSEPGVLARSTRQVPRCQHARLCCPMPWSGAVAQRMLRTLPRHRPRAAHRSTPREAASGCSPKTTGPGSTPGRGPNTSRKGPERPSRDICRGGSEARMPACHAGDGGASPLRGSNQKKLDPTKQVKLGAGREGEPTRGNLWFPFVNLGWMAERLMAAIC